MNLSSNFSPYAQNLTGDKSGKIRSLIQHSIPYACLLEPHQQVHVRLWQSSLSPCTLLLPQVLYYCMEVFDNHCCQLARTPYCTVMAQIFLPPGQDVEIKDVRKLGNETFQKFADHQITRNAQQIFEKLIVYSNYNLTLTTLPYTQCFYILEIN